MAIFVLGDDLRYVAVNRLAVCELLGYEREELLGLTAREIAPDVNVDEVLLHVIRDGRRNGRSTSGRKDGEPVEGGVPRDGRRRSQACSFFVSACWHVDD